VRVLSWIDIYVQNTPEKRKNLATKAAHLGAPSTLALQNGGFAPFTRQGSLRKRATGREREFVPASPGGKSRITMIMGALPY